MKLEIGKIIKLENGTNYKITKIIDTEQYSYIILTNIIDEKDIQLLKRITNKNEKVTFEPVNNKEELENIIFLLTTAKKNFNIR